MIAVEKIASQTGEWKKEPAKKAPAKKAPVKKVTFNPKVAVT